ncbi:MAG TPA: GumC family protein, partial [Arenimonas sp.]|nr:GumC family protein [Arenimonas sp.]
MQDNSNLPEPADDAGKLPVHQDAPRGQVVALARDRLPSLDLRGGEPERDEDEINLLDYWRIIVKRRWTVLATLGIVFVTALVGTLLMTPIYRATTTVQIERDTIKVVEVEGFTQTESPADRDFYQTQYELIRSRSLAQRVITDLNLGENAVFQRMTAPSPWRQLLGGSEPDLESMTEREAQMRETAVQAKLVNAFLDRLSIEPVRNSRLVRVHFDSIDPGFSAQVVNAVAAAYIAANLERRFDASAYAKEYLEDRLQQLKLKLEDSEKELVAFAQKERIVDTEQGNSLAAQNVGQLNTALASAQEQRAITEAKWRQTQATGGMGLPEVLASPLIQKLQENRATQLASYQDQLRIYKPDYPLMLQLKAQIDETDKQIASEVANIKASIQSQYLAAQSQENLLREQIDGLKTEALDLQSRSIQYNILRREVDTNRQQYEALLQRYKDIGIAGGVGTNNISVVDRAEIPSGKHSPRLSL